MSEVIGWEIQIRLRWVLQMAPNLQFHFHCEYLSINAYLEFIKLYPTLKPLNRVGVI